MMPRPFLIALGLTIACGPSVPDAPPQFDGWETPAAVPKADVNPAMALAHAPPSVPVNAAPTLAYATTSAEGLGVGNAGNALAAASPSKATTRKTRAPARGAAAAPEVPAASAKQAKTTLSTRKTVKGGTSSLSIGGTSVRRGLSRDQIKQVALASMGQVRACYERALKGTPSLRGRIVVDWKVAPSGRVSRASIGSDDIGDKSLRACVVDVVKGWSFPEAGKSTSVSFPFTLKPG